MRVETQDPHSMGKNDSIHSIKRPWKYALCYQNSRSGNQPKTNQQVKVQRRKTKNKTKLGPKPDHPEQTNPGSNQKPHIPGSKTTNRAVPNKSCGTRYTTLDLKRKKSKIQKLNNWSPLQFIHKSRKTKRLTNDLFNYQNPYQKVCPLQGHQTIVQRRTSTMTTNGLVTPIYTLYRSPIAKLESSDTIEKRYRRHTFILMHANKLVNFNTSAKRCCNSMKPNQYVHTYHKNTDILPALV